MTTRACHFDRHHRHTTTINGEAVSDQGAYLHARQAEADDMPDILTPRKRHRVRGPDWYREFRQLVRPDTPNGYRVARADELTERAVRRSLRRAEARRKARAIAADDAAPYVVRNLRTRRSGVA